MELIDVFTFGHVLFEMQSTYSLQEPYIREIYDCPESLSKTKVSMVEVRQKKEDYFHHLESCENISPN